MLELSVSGKDLFNEARLKKLMREAGLSVVIGTSSANVAYLSGYYNPDMQFMSYMLHAAVWPLEGEPTLVLYDNTNPMQTFISDVRRYPGFNGRDTGLRALVDVLHEKGIDGERVAVETRTLPVYVWETLRREFPNVRWEPAEDVLEATRHIKRPKEVELLRQAARATDKAIYLAYANARPTDTEKAVGDAMAYHVLRQGAEAVAFNVLASGPRTVLGHHMGEEVPLEWGSIMRCDFGALFHAYHTDLARMAVVGKPSERQRETYARYYEVHRRTLDAVRPGITGEELFHASIKAHQDMGVGGRPIVGHNIGLVLHERPVATLGETWVLEEGMVMCIEIGSHVDEHRERYHIEDAILVTRNGYELLSDYTDTTEMAVIE